ncbi:periplasmic binding protein-like I [Chytridium lagenaria]|nr:periplasmic binding protein-like I [Chytridium lagenaria]
MAALRSHCTAFSLCLVLLCTLLYSSNVKAQNARSLRIGISLAGGTPVDAEWVQGILEILDFRMDQLRANQSLHPSVRNLSLLYDEIPDVGETLAIRSAFNLYNRGVAGVIGTGYSSMTLALAPVMDAYNIPQPRSVPKLFPPSPQDNGQASAIATFLKQQGWSECAIVAAQDGYGQNLANDLTNYTKTVLNLRDSLSRVIVFIGNADEFVTISRQAGAVGIFSSGYAWITADGAKYGLETYSPDDLQYINGAINVFPTEGQGPVYETFKNQFFNANATKYPSIRSKSIQSYLLFYVNCLEAFVFGFDRHFKAYPTAVPTDNTSPWNLTGFKIPETVNFPDVETVTGRVILNEEGDRLGSYSLTFYEYKTNTWINFGEYGATGLSITGPIVYANGSTTKPFGSIRGGPTNYNNSSKLCGLPHLHFDPVVAAMCFGCITILNAFRSRKAIKAISIELSIISILGLFALSFYPVSLTGDPANWKCVAEIWVLPLSITLAVATQLCKNFRVYRVFANKFVGLSITNTSVMMWILGLVLLDMIISIVWTAYDAPSLDWDLVKLGKNYELQFVCSVEYGFHAFLFILGVALATLTRHLPPEYNQSSELTSMMYTFIAVGSFVIAILSTVKLEKTPQIVIKAIGAYAVVVLSLYNLFWTKFYALFKEYSGQHKATTKKSSNLEESGMTSSMNAADTSSAGGESVEKCSDLKLIKKTYPISELCYLREKTNIGIVTWTPYVISAPVSGEVLVFLFSARSSIQNITLFSSDWIVKPIDSDPAVPKKEPFYALKLTKTLQSVVTQPEVVVRFKEPKGAEEWLQILGPRCKVQAGGDQSGTANGVSRKISMNTRSMT